MTRNAFIFNYTILMLHSLQFAEFLKLNFFFKIDNFLLFLIGIIIRLVLGTMGRGQMFTNPMTFPKAVNCEIMM